VNSLQHLDPVVGLSRLFVQILHSDITQIEPQRMPRVNGTPGRPSAQHSPPDRLSDYAPGKHVGGPFRQTRPESNPGASESQWKEPVRCIFDLKNG